MTCDECGERDSVVQVYTAVGDTHAQRNLCTRCAAELGVEVTESEKHPLGDFLKAVQLQLSVAPSEGGRCIVCSATLFDFRETGRLGCPACYTSFENSLRELLRRLHGSTEHVGVRYTSPTADGMDPALLLAELRDQLQTAINNEDFERAAAVRDKIRDLE